MSDDCKHVARVAIRVVECDGWKVAINAEYASYLTPDEADDVALAIMVAADEARKKNRDA